VICGQTVHWKERGEILSEKCGRIALTPMDASNSDGSEQIQRFSRTQKRQISEEEKRKRERQIRLSNKSIITQTERE